MSEVNPMQHPDSSSLIDNEFSDRGFDLTPEQLQALSLLLRELRRWNEKINLTGLKTDEAMVRVLLLGSAAFLSAHAFGPAEKVMDLGSGAGFPGIPLKILSPAIDLTLVEAREKKVAFLKHIIRMLKLSDTRCLHARAEELARKEEMRGRFHLVTARAAGKLESILKAASPLISEGGLLITTKGPGYAARLNAAAGAVSRAGMELLRVVSPSWGAGEGPNLLVFRKVAKKHSLD